MRALTIRKKARSVLSPHKENPPEAGSLDGGYCCTSLEDRNSRATQMLVACFAKVNRNECLPSRTLDGVLGGMLWP